MQNVLFLSRYLMIFAVFSSLVSTLVVLFLGIFEVYAALCKLIFFLKKEIGLTITQFDIVHHIINSIDLFLTSTVLLIFSVGLYELFIQKVSFSSNTKLNNFNVLIVKNLDQLKTKLAQTIIMILIVEFFQKATQLSYVTPIDLIYLGCGIFLISVAVFITHVKT